MNKDRPSNGWTDPNEIKKRGARPERRIEEEISSEWSGARS